MTRTSLEEPSPSPPPEPGLRRNVWVVGFTSMLTDISSEMIYPLLAPFLVLSLGAKPIHVGLIEGLAESTAALLKVVSGWYSDRIGRRKPVAWAGYGLSSLGKMLLFAAGSWSTVLLARLVERTGKGIRTAPRDALVADSVAAGERGRAFGVRTALDFLGGMVGVALAWWLLGRLLDEGGGVTDVEGIRTVIAWSLVPAGLALLLPALLREPPRPVDPAPHPSRVPRLSLRGFSPSLRAFLLAAVIFNLGNSSNQFLLLRSKELMAAAGLTPLRALSTSILCYVLFKGVVTVLGVPLGAISDRIGRKRLVVGGYGLYAVVYLLFAGVEAGWGLWALWGLYGVYTALTDGLEKALVSDLAPREVRATALGCHGTAVGVALLPASILAGWLYEVWTPAPFLFGSVAAALAALVVMAGVRVEQQV